jgi:hypothetical protein
MKKSGAGNINIGEEKGTSVCDNDCEKRNKYGKYRETMCFEDTK